MSLPDAPKKPESGLLQELASRKWFTTVNFAYILAGVLAIAIVILFAAGMRKAGSHKKYPHELVAISAQYYNKILSEAKNKSAVVTLLYDSQCENCGREVSALLNLRKAQSEGQIELVFISFDADPVDTMRFLQRHRVPTNMVTYYADPQTHNVMRTAIARSGSTAIDMRFPHTLVYTKEGKLLVEYKGYIRAQEILRALELSRLMAD